jgi:formylglycine-generating enzyme required for sulfatase activity
MRNFVIGYIVLLAMAGTACNKEPKPSEKGKAPNESAAGGEAKSSPKELTVDLGGGVKLEMVLIPAGEFLMGSPDSDKDACPWEKPQHRVRITKPFYLGKYLVTQEQWEAVMGANPSAWRDVNSGQGSKNPVEQVTWDDCQTFLGKLNAKFAAGEGKFQLPTDAQWEYACRAGSKTKYCFGDDKSKLGEYAWYGENSGGKTHPVGEKKPNAWGLYDMHGHVSEWCKDLFQYGYYEESPVDDPMGAATGLGHVYRGGSWSTMPRDPAWYCRSAYRDVGELGRRRADLGFRVSRVLADK